MDLTDEMHVPKGQQEKETYPNGLQKKNQNSQAGLACTQTENNVVTKTNHMRYESVNGENDSFADTSKDQNFITWSQNNQN